MVNAKASEGNAAQTAYRLIKENILAWQYPPGFQLREIPISEELGLTRTPVREAIIKLESEGLVRTFPNRGAFVIKLTLKEVEDLFDVREALEVKASELATRRANREQVDAIREALRKHEELLNSSESNLYHQPVLDFHEALMGLSQNEPLMELWRDLRSKLLLARSTSAQMGRRYLTALNEHKKILQLIQDGDAGNVRELLIDHIAQAKHNVFARWRN